MAHRFPLLALTVLLGIVAAVSTSLLVWTWLALGPPLAVPETPPAPPAPLPARVLLEPASFADLPGWADDPVARALPAFLRSCEALERLPDERPLASGGVAAVAGAAADWRGACRAARALPAGDDRAARAFFETRFTPWAVTNRGRPVGLFTGYYEASLRGSRARHGAFTVPLYTRPPELVSVDLGLFRDDLRGRRIAGRVRDGVLVPFADRAAITGGALARRGLELLWVDDPVGAFFLEVQGSGRVELDDGTVVRVGYAGQNGRPYTSIGRELVDRGEMALEGVSLQSIRDWLESHPEERREVMAANASYVFFRILPGDGPLGSLGVALTAGRSLAVDRAFLPLGVPVWLDSSAPSPVPGGPQLPLRRLLVAQDTGGAIRGPVRGDVFWGHGAEAEEVAGRMRSPGRMWLLAPRRPATP